MSPYQSYMNQLKQRPEPKLLSIVIPCYNETEAVDSLRLAMEDFVQQTQFNLEVVLVDDGSSDDTWDKICKWKPTFFKLKAITLSRHFGHQLAVTAGLDKATGDAVVVMDADLQDPPSVIRRMVKAYCQGYDVVHGKRIHREGETIFKKVPAWFFNRLMKFAGASHLTLNSGDFRLVSRRCLDQVLRMREQKRFLSDLYSWAGFPQTFVNYRGPSIKKGETKYSLQKMGLLAWTALVSFSLIPLRLASISGLLTIVGGAGYGLYTILRWARYGDTVDSWATLVILLSGIGGMGLLTLGILGEYVARIYEELRQRPIYIVQDEFKFNNDYNQPIAQPGNRIFRRMGELHPTG